MVVAMTFLAKENHADSKKCKIGTPSIIVELVKSNTVPTTLDDAAKKLLLDTRDSLIKKVIEERNEIAEERKQKRKR